MDALTVQCPYCTAETGRPCLAPSGKLRCTPHRVRDRLARNRGRQELYRRAEQLLAMLQDPGSVDGAPARAKDVACASPHSKSATR
jgi:hypothetical protein